MAKVPLPDRGQPLDVSYLYQLAEAINNLSNELSPTVAKYTTIDTTGSRQSIRTSDARIIGGFKAVTNSSSNTTGAEEPFSYTFSDFKFPPIVTATPITTDDQNTESSRNVSITLTSITTNRVDGFVKFKTIGVSSVGVNLIIVGIPVS